MRILISNSSPTPLYEQIVEQVRTAILSGQAEPGSALPSIRVLARDLRISVITTSRAYTELARQGFIVNVQGKGAFVLGVNPDLVREQSLRAVEASLSRALDAAQRAGLDRDDLVTMLDTLIASRGSHDDTASSHAADTPNSIRSAS